MRATQSVCSDFRAAVDAIPLSRQSLRTIKGNAFSPFAHNVTALPLPAAAMTF